MTPPELLPAPKLAPPAPADAGQPLPESVFAGLYPLVAGLLVLAARLWHLAATPLPDYDSGRNWLTVQELARGEFHELFRHASPTFYLLNLPLVRLFANDFHGFINVNALIGTLGVALLAATVRRYAGLRRLDEALLTLLIGFSSIYTFAGRDFAITSPALLLFAGVLNRYARRLTAEAVTTRRRALLAATAVLAVGYTINYKLVLLLPLALVLEWQHRRDGTLSWRTVVGGLALLGLPLVAYAGIAYAVGLPWYRLPATWASMVLQGPNAAGRDRMVGLDLTYYFQYLIRFETPLALLGLVTGTWLAFRRPASGLATLARLLLLPGAGLLVLLSLLVKAPRGLVFTVGPLTALGALGIYAVFGPQRRSLARLVLLAAAVAQVGTLWREIWRWYPVATATPPAYAQVASWLRHHNARQVTTTVGLALAPYAEPLGVVVTPATHPEELAAPPRYVLLDGYRCVTGLDSLGAHLPGRAVLHLPEPALLPPLLFLEHSEYTGDTYAATLARQRRAARRRWQLVVIDTQRP